MKNLLRLSISTFLILTLFTMTGCKKDDAGKNAPDKKTLLTSHIWKFDNLTTTSTNSDILLIVGLMKTFMGNATVNFTTGGTYTRSMLGESDNGSWEFNAGETSIIMDKGAADESEVIIVQLTSDVLEFKENVQDDNLGTFDVNYKWVK
jgi:hypothetical protein